MNPIQSRFLTIALMVVGCTPMANAQDGESKNAFSSPDHKQIQQQIKAATKERAAAKTNDEKSEATDKLAKALGDDYDARLAEYENHLNQVAKRLDEMRANWRDVVMQSRT